MKHLFIPDPHAHADFNNNRFTWLGNLIADVKPDHVICAGDWADMSSLCSYDYGTKGYEGRRYIKDINAAIDAQEKMFKPIKAKKKKLPKFWMLIGNHEHRITKACNADAKLDGVLSINDLQYKEYGWEVVDYAGTTPGILQLDGINYAHYFTSGVMGRPVSGVKPAYSLIQKFGVSCTQGHSHTFDFYHRANAMSDVYGLVAGVYQDYYSDFAGNANSMWWRGIVFKTDVTNGSYDLHTIRLNKIAKAYRG